MCLLVLYFNPFSPHPLVLAANRDEFYRRPAAPPRRWEPEEGTRPFLAPVDLEAGGTWIGLNTDAAVAAVTNRKAGTYHPRAPSRGRLLARVLAQGRAEGMARAGLELGGEGAYNGFNLLVADQEGAWVLTGGDRRVRCVALSPGVHVLTNEHDLDAIAVPWKAPVAGEEGGDGERVAALIALLQRHEPLSPDGFAPCKHLGDRGTRSATIITLSKEGSTFLYADGPPCTTPFQDYGTD